MATAAKRKSSFGDIFAKYKTYDPATEGFGSAEQWSGSFYERMGFQEAEEVLHGQNQTPRQILGVGLKATWEEVRKAYRVKSRLCHPDLCSEHGLSVEAATEAFKRVSAAYTVLEREFGK